MKLCGRKSPGVIATNSSTVTLDYHTDNEGLSHGWSLDYSTYGEGQRERNIKFCFVDGNSFTTVDMCLLFGYHVFSRGQMSISGERGKRQRDSCLNWIFLQRLYLCDLWPRIQVDDGLMFSFFHCPFVNTTQTNKQTLLNFHSCLLFSLCELEIRDTVRETLVSFISIQYSTVQYSI